MIYAPAWQGLAPLELLRPAVDRALPFPLGAPRSAYFYRARNAIYYMARSLELDRCGPVLVPEYHHGNEVAAMRAAGARVTFYPIRSDFTPDLESLARLCRAGASALFVIHYLGWPQPLDPIEELCRRHGLLLIEDCALALLSGSGGRPLGSRGDYSVFCLYKTLPVPNGGVLAVNGAPLRELEGLSLRPCSRLSVAGRSMELASEWLRGRSDTLGRALSACRKTAGRTLSAVGLRREPVGDTGFSREDADLAISRLSRSLIRRFDYDAIVSRRRWNFERLRRRLEGRVLMPRDDLPEGVCPLFFPLMVADKAAASRALLGRGVGNVQFWNQGDPEADAQLSDGASWLRRHLLEIPIHQGLSQTQVDHAARQVLALGPLLDVRRPEGRT